MAWPAGAGGGLELKYVAIISRHGVRSPTWQNARLDAFSAEPWPEWQVPAGNLTPRGRRLIELRGSYYRQWLASEHLLRGAGCQDSGRIYIHADKDQRTLETGRAFAESMAPGCGGVLRASRRPAGFSSPAAERRIRNDAAAVRERLGPDPQNASPIIAPRSTRCKPSREARRRPPSWVSR